MNQDGGGWLWLVIDVGFVGILGLTLAYGTMQRRQMSARQKQRRDDATRDHPQKTHWWYVRESTNGISALPQRGFIPACG